MNNNKSNFLDASQHLFSYQRSQVANHSLHLPGLNIFTGAYLLENVYKNGGVFINVRQDVRTTLRHQVYKSSYTNLSGLRQDTQRWTKWLSEEG